MTTQNSTQKKIIKALATAPAAALCELIRQTTDATEREQIRKIAAALKIDISKE